MDEEGREGSDGSGNGNGDEKVRRRDSKDISEREDRNGEGLDEGYEMG